MEKCTNFRQKPLPGSVPCAEFGFIHLAFDLNPDDGTKGDEMRSTILGHQQQKPKASFVAQPGRRITPTGWIKKN